MTKGNACNEHIVNEKKSLEMRDQFRLLIVSHWKIFAVL